MTDTEKNSAGWRADTVLVRGGSLRSENRETSEALYLTSGYVYGCAEEAEESFANKRERYVYSRYNNPNLTMLEERLRLIEGAEACRTTASGMAAVYAALICQLRSGSRVVAARALFGSSLFIFQEIFPRFGIRVDLVDAVELEQWRAALSTPADIVFLETPSNPTLEIVDLAEVSRLAHAAGARVIVDNVFATPLLQKPLELGADVIVYSATKHIDGQGRCLGGAILGDMAFIKDVLTPFLRHTGPVLSAFNAWLMLKSLETLPVRVEKHCRNALAVARFLEGRRGLKRVLYPELESHPQHALAMKQMKAGGTVIALDLEGGRDASFRFQNALRLIDISNNLGDAKSLICHPATTTHQRLSDEDKARLGISPGLLRLSVGLEDPADLCEDLERALAAAG